MSHLLSLTKLNEELVLSFSHLQQPTSIQPETNCFYRPSGTIWVFYLALDLSVYTDLPQSNPNLILSIRLGGSKYRSC